MSRRSRTAHLTVLAMIAGLAASAQAATVNYWRFEEGAPNAVASGMGSVLDSVGTDHGTPSGIPTYRTDVPFAVVPQTGAPNTLSLELVGFQDLVAFASSFPLNQPGDKTIEFWLKWNLIHHGATLWGRPDSLPDENRFDLHVNFDFTLGFHYISPAGELHVLSPPPDGAPQDGVPVSQGQWAHIAITRQGDTYRIYVNGVLLSTVTDQNPDLPNLFGWSIGGGQFPFVGLVDEMRVSDEALTPDRFLNAPPPPAVKTVKIDILPLGCILSKLNLVDPDSWFPIPVAILTTPDFDAKTVDPSTVRFGRTGTEAPPQHPHFHPVFIDVDRDGDRDMVLWFRTRMTGIQCGDTKAFLTGTTKDGQAFQGEDRIKTIGCGRGPGRDDDDDDDRDDKGRHHGWRR